MRLWQVLTVGVLLGLLLVAGADARRRKKKDRKTTGNRDLTGVCKYKGRPSIVGDCDPTTNTRPFTFPLKAARSGADCQPFQTKDMPCDFNVLDRRMTKKQKKWNKKKSKKNKRCKYMRGVRSACDLETNRVEVTRTLKPGQPSECDQVKKRFKKCKKKDRKPRRGCVYDKRPWSECKAEKNLREREMVLISGSERLCNPRKLVTKPCKKVCRFDKGDWSECTPDSTHSHRRLTPKPGSPEQCKVFTQTQLCTKLAEMTGAKASKCRYKAGPWSECDPRSDTVTKVWTLKNGDPNLCKPVKEISRKCKNTCKFQRGEWSECDGETGLTTRIDRLVKGSTTNCDRTRSITRKCKKACKYEWGEWGECTQDTNQRSRQGTLTKGDPEKCLPTTSMYRPCTNRNGEERCFFGPWGDFGPCQNGVMTKHRQVLQGGVECERKAAMNQACVKAPAS